MSACRLITTDELESLAGSWNALAGGMPFRRHEWLSAWWRHYGAGCELYTLAIEEQEELIGLAPFYLQRSVMRRPRAAAAGRWRSLLGLRGHCCAPRSEPPAWPRRSPSGSVTLQPIPSVAGMP